jgi:cytochrome c-type biogenesis protein CcmH
VTLDEALRDQASPGDTLFVYARAPAGPRMPLAIVRLSAADLPATVTLDDSSAMMPNMKLSTFDEVMVLARISRSGDAMTRSGDLQGSTGPVRVEGSARVEVVIDTRAP